MCPVTGTGRAGTRLTLQGRLSLDLAGPDGSWKPADNWSGAFVILRRMPARMPAPTDGVPGSKA